MFILIAKNLINGGSIANLLPDPAAPGSIPNVSKSFSEEKIVNVAKVNQRHCLEESWQRDSGLKMWIEPNWYWEASVTKNNHI